MESTGDFHVSSFLWNSYHTLDTFTWSLRLRLRSFTFCSDHPVVTHKSGGIRPSLFWSFWKFCPIHSCSTTLWYSNPIQEDTFGKFIPLGAHDTFGDHSIPHSSVIIPRADCLISFVCSGWSLIPHLIVVRWFHFTPLHLLLFGDPLIHTFTICYHIPKPSWFSFVRFLRCDFGTIHHTGDHLVHKFGTTFDFISCSVDHL